MPSDSDNWCWWRWNHTATVQWDTNTHLPPYWQESAERHCLDERYCHLRPGVAVLTRVCSRSVVWIKGSSRFDQWLPMTTTGPVVQCSSRDGSRYYPRAVSFPIEPLATMSCSWWWYKGSSLLHQNYKILRCKFHEMLHQNHNISNY